MAGLSQAQSMEAQPHDHQTATNHETRDKTARCTGDHSGKWEAGREVPKQVPAGCEEGDGMPDHKNTAVITSKMLTLADYKTIVTGRSVRGRVLPHYEAIKHPLSSAPAHTRPDGERERTAIYITKYVTIITMELKYARGDVSTGA